MSKRRHEWFRVQNATSSEEATVYVYDVIDSWFGVDAQAFVRELAGITAPKIHVRINSPGGSVFDGMAIYNALKQHPSSVTTHVDGLAASAASVIALAGDEVLMGEGAFFMIHNAWGMAMGDAEEMRAMADTLEQINASLVGIYSRKTGMDADEVQELMNKETWMNVDDAIDRGFADAEEEGKKASASYDLLNKFKNVPRELAAAANPPERRSSEPEKKTERTAERALRDAGFSHAEAKAIVTCGYKPADAEPRDEDDGMAELQNALRQRGDTFGAASEPRDEAALASLKAALGTRGDTLTLANR